MSIKEGMQLLLAIHIDLNITESNLILCEQQSDIKNDICGGKKIHTFQKTSKKCLLLCFKAICLLKIKQFLDCQPIGLLDNKTIL